MTACPEREATLHAWLDGELDSLGAAAFEAHLRGCAGCNAAVAQWQGLRAGLAALAVEPAPPHLHRRIAAALDAEAPRAPGRLRQALPWLGGGTIGALAASLAFLLALPPAATLALPDELVAGHVRSLEADHLVDVATSDRHTVKPWFNGRLDFAPPVVDLASAGFPLAGGRLDYIGGRAVAALVFRRERHTINLFICPERAGIADTAELRHASYGLVHWRQGGLDFWAVSDTDMPALERFRDAFAAATRA